MNEPDATTAPAPLLSLTRDACHPLASSLGREWLETNGLGGYASSTVAMCATRRYHGLLVATPPGMDRRHVFLARFAESLHRSSKSFSIDAACYAGTYHPKGYGSIEEFSLVPWPRFDYRLGRTVVTREVLMVEGEPTVLCRYRLDSEHDDIELRLRPVLACREADALTFENLALDPRTQRTDTEVRCRPYDALPQLTFRIDGADWTFEADPTWFRGVELGADIERGYDGHEDHFSPGWFSLRLEPGKDVVVGATIADDVFEPAALFAREANARRACAQARSDDLAGRLESAADAYLVETPSGRTGVVAGYPWFGEWGRDTAIALPGLLLARGRVEACGQALEDLLPHLRDGLLPNVFGATPETSHYGSVDASLWFARAVRLWELAGGGAKAAAATFREPLEQIARHYRDGTALGTSMDEGGLITSGDGTTNATWMDARTSQGPVTPRAGCAVEINALWYFLLAYLEQLAKTAGDKPAARTWRDLRRRAKTSFVERFWLRGEAYLADVWKDGEADVSIRPNMVIAAALEWSPLSRGQRTDVVQCAKSELLTPFGLRTLAPKDAAYEPRYEGDPETRDAAYHQGTVWPWLLGFYCEAVLRAYGGRKKRVARLRELLEGFLPHLEEAGLNQISEVFDGDPPHHPGGTVAQAWSVSELLRALRMLEARKP